MAPLTLRPLEPQNPQTTFLIDFQCLTLYPSLTPRERHPPSSSYFPLMIWFQNAPLLIAYFQFHLHKRALFNKERHLTLDNTLLSLFFVHTVSYFIRCIFFSDTPSTERKPLWIFSNLNLTFLRMLNKDKKYMFRLDKVLLVNVSLPSLEIYYLFHIESLLWNPSSTPS